MTALAGAAPAGAAGGAATKGLTGMMGLAAITTAVTSTVQGGMDIMASNRNLMVHESNLNQQPAQNMKIPEISTK